MSKASPSEVGMRVFFGSETQAKLFGVLDRAHFPTNELVTRVSDQSPARSSES